MKILIYSDIHISIDSVGVKSTGSKYSKRLENIIQSISWAEDLAIRLNCEVVVNLGDTFDKPLITAIEATAIQDITWAGLPHYILIGNHDSNIASLEYSSASVFKRLPNFNIIDTPQAFQIPETDKIICFIPYITENMRKPLTDYIIQGKTNIVLSHNDIAGFSFGKFISKEGFNIKEIEDNCALFLNGHLHNSAYLTKKILNVGNLTGQNFGEDAFKYKHGAWLLDTDTLELQFFENPYALRYYKLDIINKEDFNIIDTINNTSISNTNVLRIKCNKEYLADIKDKLNECNNILSYRINVINNSVDNTVDINNVELKKTDYLKMFEEFISERLELTSELKSELAEICK